MNVRSEKLFCCIVCFVSLITGLTARAAWSIWDPPLENKYGEHEFLAACKEGREDIVAHYLEQGDFDVNQEYTSGLTGKKTTGIFVAAMNGRDGVVKLLLEQVGIEADKVDTSGYTPLAVACGNGHCKVVSMLLDVSREVLNTECLERTPLGWAIVGNHVDVVRILTEQVDLEINKKCGKWLPLFIASIKGFLEIVKLLISQTGRIDVNQASDYGVSPFFIAVQQEHKEIVTALAGAGADPNLTWNGATPLYHVANRGQHDMVEFLLINIPGVSRDKARNGETPLYIAAQNGHEKVVEYLISHNADPDLANKDGVTPLWIAAQNGHEKVVEHLISHNADPDLANKDGVTPLWIAAENGHEKVVEILTSISDVDCNKAWQEATPLFIAAQNGHAGVVRFLVRSGGVDLNKPWRGKTPLYEASRMGHADVVQVLLETPGVNCTRCNNTGVTPLAVAKYERPLKLWKICFNKEKRDAYDQIVTGLQRQMASINVQSGGSHTLRLRLSRHWGAPAVLDEEETDQHEPQSQRQRLLINKKNYGTINRQNWKTQGYLW